VLAVDLYACCRTRCLPAVGATPLTRCLAPAVLSVCLLQSTVSRCGSTRSLAAVEICVRLLQSQQALATARAGPGGRRHAARPAPTRPAQPVRRTAAPPIPHTTDRHDGRHARRRQRTTGRKPARADAWKRLGPAALRGAARKSADDARRRGRGRRGRQAPWSGLTPLEKGIPTGAAGFAPPSPYRRRRRGAARPKKGSPPPPPPTPPSKSVAS
jgi:hypothetical protein